jgi:hypothetical protein
LRTVIIASILSNVIHPWFWQGAVYDVTPDGKRFLVVFMSSRFQNSVAPYGSPSTGVTTRNGAKTARNFTSLRLIAS